MTKLLVNKTNHTMSIQKIITEITFASIFLHLGPDQDQMLFRCLPLVTLKLVQFTHSNYLLGALEVIFVFSQVARYLQ